MLWLEQVLAAAAGMAAVGLGLALGLRAAWKPLARWLLARFLRRLFSDTYHENLWETVTGLRRFGVQAVVETQLRAASGKLLLRPFGRFQGFPGFDEVLFDPAQLARLPTSERVPVDMSVTIGPRSARPLRIEIPILITGMGYGVALSPQAKVALARGSAAAGTATNTGEGPLLPEARRSARALVIQYNRGSWNKTPEVLRQADMIEIQLGQGAEAGSGAAIDARGFPPELRRAFGLAPDRAAALIHSRLPGVERPADLAVLVATLRAVTGGVPVGVKIAATGRIEADLELALRAGVDAVTIDGAEAGTHGAPPILADDFGLPTFMALCRAGRYLASLPAAERPSLIVSGGLFSPGHYLKALALGADAVAIGTAALFALGHGQTPKALPFEPPLDIVWFGRPAARRLDVDRAARSLARYLASAREEMEVAVRALGKTSVRAVGRSDLMATDARVATLAGVRLAWVPQRAPAGDVLARGASAPAPPAGDVLARGASVRAAPAGDVLARGASAPAAPPGDVLARSLSAHLKAWTQARDTLAALLAAPPGGGATPPPRRPPTPPPPPAPGRRSPARGRAV